MQCYLFYTKFTFVGLPLSEPESRNDPDADKINEITFFSPHKNCTICRYEKKTK